MNQCRLTIPELWSMLRNDSLEAKSFAVQLCDIAESKGATIDSMVKVVIDRYRQELKDEDCET